MDGEYINAPGIGGSLGQCAICGKDFMLEILIGATVRTFQMDGVEGVLCAHRDCLQTLEEIPQGVDNWKALPDGPLRQAYEKANQ